MNRPFHLSRRGFIGSALATGVAQALGAVERDARPCHAGVAARDYAVPLLGDTHFDGLSPETYHAAFIRRFQAAGKHPNKFREHLRNAKMWAGPSREIVRASASLSADAAFVLHLGDLVQGDCSDGATHRKMLEDAWRYFKGEYGEALPFVTVCGNHDVRDPDGSEAERAYADFMPPHLAKELGSRAVGPIASTDFVFRQGPDLFFVFDFNDNKEAKVREPTISHAKFARQKRLLLENRAERYTFVVVHGGVFPLDKATDFRWFYLGDPRQDAERREMLALLAERHAIVLCGHQHVLSLKEAAFPQGRITEFTMNSVFFGRGMKENPAVPHVVYDDPKSFGSLSGENEWWKGADARIHDEYRPHLQRGYHANAVGHAVLRVSDAGVAVDYYGHAATRPTAVFTLREPPPRLVFGVMSDMHITDEKSCEHVVDTLRLFRDRNVGAVVFAGDMIDNGLVGELELFAKQWFSVFPCGLGRDGRKVEMLAVLGNHDLQRWTKEWADEIHMPWERVLREDLDQEDRMAKTWRRLFGEPLQPLWMTRVNGVRFVGSNYQYRSDRQRRTALAGGEEMPAFLERNRATLAKDDVFFFIQHMHPKGTCSAPWAWGQDDGTATEILKTFPNAIALSGHSHTPLNDERTLWRGAFTSVGTAATGFLIPFGGRENSEIDGLPDSGDQLLPRLRPADGKHAMICRVGRDRVVFERWDVANMLPLAADWVVPIPPRADALGDRAMRAKPPVFAKDAKVEVRTEVVRDRKGNEKKARIAVFPNACSPRAFDYAVQLDVQEQDVLSVRRMKRVYSEGFYRAETCDVPTVACPFAEEDFPAPNGNRPGEKPAGRRWRFTVWPCDSFGNRGPAILSAWFDA